VRKADIGMNYSTRSDLKKALLSSRFFLSAIVVFVILIRSMINYHVLLWHVFDRLYLLTIPMALSGFAPFAAIFAVIPYTTSFCDDYNSGYIKVILTRIGPKKYMNSKILSVAISGAAAIGIPFFLIFSLITLIGIPTTLENLSEAYLGNSWFPYIAIGGGTLVLVAKLLLSMLFGAVWALVGLAVSSWFTNRYVTIIAPFVLYQALWVLLEGSPYNPLYMLGGDFELTGAFVGSYPYVLLYQTTCIVLLVLLIKFGMRRRLKNV